MSGIDARKLELRAVTKMLADFRITGYHGRISTLRTAILAALPGETKALARAYMEGVDHRTKGLPCGCEECKARAAEQPITGERAP